jgi:hypothetical protein
VGQSLSVRPDICPQEYLDEFAELQDNIPSFATPIALALIKEELGVSVSFCFPADWDSTNCTADLSSQKFPSACLIFFIWTSLVPAQIFL